MRFRKFLKPYKTRGSSFREHTLIGGEVGAGVESKVATLNTGGELAVCPMLDDQVMAEGFFFDADLFHLREEDGDIYFNYGAELYVSSLGNSIANRQERVDFQK